MQRFKPKNLLVPLTLGLLLAQGTATAAVPAAAAAKLGSSLTPIGAEQGANANGSIPAWDGGLPASNGDRYQNPFAGEQPLYTISADNLAEYQENLTPGQIALFKKYPATFRMPVYPTHRSAALPEAVYAKIKGNATEATLSADGNGVQNYQEAIPFPIPQSGLEVIWNHITRYRGGSLERTVMQSAVHSNGNYTPVRIRERMVWPQYLKEGLQDKDANILTYFTQEVLSPARLTGNVLLVHETLNQIQQPREAWLYNAGQRRVRRAPQIAYDAPGTATDGQRTSDNLDMFNGAPDRYDWQLIGKQELFIPYNSFKLADRKLKYADLIRPGHLNPEHTRYERHRVWVVEATLKPGERHLYAKRVFYIDEDTWQAAIVDHYDARGQLWRVAEAHAFPYRDAQVPWLAGEALYDLISGRYLVGSLTNEEEQGFDFSARFAHRDFTPQAIRRMGKR